MGKTAERAGGGPHITCVWTETRVCGVRNGVQLLTDEAKIREKLNSCCLQRAAKNLPTRGNCDPRERWSKSESNPQGEPWE
jgi:hypothetical protein